MADMTWTGKWNSICVVDKFIQPCNYTISVDFNTTDTEVINQHTAYGRIKFFVDEILHESILISGDSPYLPAFKDSEAKVICLGSDPVDVTLAAVLWSKIECFCEGHLLLERISISSDVGEGLVSHIDADFVDALRMDLLSDPFLEHNNKIWWNRPDLAAMDWVEITQKDDTNLAVIHIEERAWPDFLTWDADPMEVKNTDGENVVSIKNRQKWKPEVITGDKT